MLLFSTDSVPGLPQLDHRFHGFSFMRRFLVAFCDDDDVIQSCLMVIRQCGINSVLQYETVECFEKPIVNGNMK